jgi:hypothetical protein
MAIVWDDEQPQGKRKPKAAPAAPRRIVFDDEVQPPTFDDKLQGTADAIRNNPASLVGQIPVVGQALQPIVQGVQNMARPIINRIGQQSQLGPTEIPGTQLLQKAQNQVSDIANAGGQFAAQQFAQNGANPYLAAAAGTAMQMAPDIAASVVNPATEMGAPARVAPPDAAVELAQRAAGAQKRFLQTPAARAEARRAGRVALDNGLIPATGNPERFMENARAMTERTGARLGIMRQAAGPTRLDPIFDDLERLRETELKGRTGGEWDAKHASIDDAQKTLLGLINRGANITLNDLVEAKTAIRESLNFLTDKGSEKLSKRLAARIEDNVGTILGERGGNMRTYRELKRKFGAGKSLQTYLNNELAGQTGNDLTSLGTKVVGAGVAGGSKAAGAAAAGAMELLKRRGAGIGANLINSAASAQRQVSPLVMALQAQRRSRQKK